MTPKPYILLKKMKEGEKMIIDTVIFDLDGTLLNTLEDIKDSVNFALNEFNFPIKSAIEVKKHVGNGAQHLMNQMVPDNTSPEVSVQCYQCYQKHYDGNSQNKTKPYDGILNLLKQLKEKKLKLAVVSNKFDASVKSLCQDYFADYIQIAIGESPKVARKPAPDSVYNAIQELHADINRVIYVGDSDVDIYTAHNAGIPCIGVTWGFRDKVVLEKAGADFIIDKPDELFNCLLVKG